MANSDAVSPGLYADWLAHESCILFDATNASYFSLLYVCVCVCVCVSVCVLANQLSKYTRNIHIHTHPDKFYLYKYNLFIQIKFLSRKIYDIKMTNIDIFRTINYENHI